MKMKIFAITSTIIALIGFWKIAHTGWEQPSKTLEVITGLATWCALGSLIYFGWSIYMLPARIAKKHNHPHAETLFMVNLLLGWTILTWLICLIIATNGTKTSTTLEGALKELEKLRRKKLITDEEYATKRAQILS